MPGTATRIAKLLDLLERGVLTASEFADGAIDHMAEDVSFSPRALVRDLPPVARNALFVRLHKYAEDDYFSIPFMIGPPQSVLEREQLARERQPKLKRVGEALEGISEIDA